MFEHKYNNQNQKFSINNKENDVMNKLPSLFSLLCAKIFRKKLSKRRQWHLKIEEFTDDYIKRKLDIIYYLKMNDEFINLKKVLLNQSQEIALNYFEKIDIMDEECIALELEKMKMDEQRDKEELIKYFRRIRQTNDNSSLDERILKLLDGDIKVLI